MTMGTAAGLSSVAHANSQSNAPSPTKIDDYVRPTDLKGIPKSLVLYQYEVCPFCCKVKAALDFYKVPYQVIEVNPLTSAELKWAGLKKVPVIKMDGDEVMVESSRIMSRIAAEVEAKAGGNKLSTKAKVAAIERETKWRRWVDERFVKIITANIYRSWDETWNTFKYITDQTNWSWGTRELARVSGALIMWQVGKNMPKKYNIEGDLREALYASCNEFVAAMDGKAFMGGSTPDLADLAAYGVLTAVQSTPTFTDVMKKSKLKPWYERVKAAIGNSSRIA